MSEALNRPTMITTFYIRSVNIHYPYHSQNGSFTEFTLSMCYAISFPDSEPHIMCGIGLQNLLKGLNFYKKYCIYHCIIPYFNSTLYILHIPLCSIFILWIFFTYTSIHRHLGGLVLIPEDT